MNIRITDIDGLKPSFTQWDVDRVLYVDGCATKPMLHFWNDTLTRAIVVEPEADGSRWVCRVPNILLQHFMPIAVSVFIQEEDDEGKTVARFVLPVRPKAKPQDYTYEENIGYVNWVEKSEEAQELLDNIDDLRQEIQSAAATATSASEAAVAAAEGIDETVAAALQAAKDSGDFDGADGQDGQDGAPGPKGDAGEDGVSPRFSSTAITGGHRIAVQDAYGDYTFDVMDGEDGEDAVSPTVTSESITGGHRLTITDADGVTTVDVMDGQDGQDGQDAVVDPTLSNPGEAADAAETGKVAHTADYALTFAETLNSGAGIPLDAEWERGGLNNSGANDSRKYRARTVGTVQASVAVTVKAASGYQFFAVRYNASGSRIGVTDWLTSRELPVGESWRICVRAYPENTSVTADPDVFGAAITIQNNIGSGGGGSGVTVDDALSGSSTNPVQNKVVKAALDGKYAKPAGGIPASDLASAVQTSLGKADTALQSAPVTSVNGQTGAVTLTIPTTASDVGAVAANQGVANANKVLTVNSSGVVVPEDNRFVVTLTPTAQDFSGVMDKTVAEITAAYEAGKKIVFKVLGANDASYVECSMQYASDSCTYPSFNGFIITDAATPGLLIFAFTGTTDDGTKATYSTDIYPLASGQWTGGSY